ncbi:glycosyltransferase family 61 protein [Candidatus Pelagibacter sp.]|nr:glycosyltransferase family 61 protein [Candidatus Pelagibacter sp.]
MLKKKLQLYFKILFQNIFLIIYGKIKTEDINYLDNQDKLIIIDNIKSDTYPDHKYFLYKIKNGRIHTDLNENVSIINKNNLISECSFQQINGKLKNKNFNSTLFKGTPRLKKKFKGIIFNLTQGGSGNNYFHFIFDLIPKIYLLKEKLPIRCISYFYVPEITDWQQKIYILFGIGKERLIDSKKIRHVEADWIIASSHPWYFKGYFQDETINIPQWIVNYNRNNFLPLMKKFNNNKKIFLDRSSSVFTHCQIKNNDEIINTLSKKGFTTYKVEDLSFEEQIFLFNDASIIVGAHGAAFTNIIFCKPETKIIEIIPTSHPSRKCQRISKILKLNYKRIIVKENNNDKNFPFNIILNKQHLNEIENIIDQD